MQWKVKVSSWWYSNALLRLGNNFWCNMESKIFYVGHWLWLSWESGCFPLQTSTFESGSNPVIGIIYIEYSLWTVLKRRNLGFCFFLKNVHYPIFSLLCLLYCHFLVNYWSIKVEKYLDSNQGPLVLEGTCKLLHRYYPSFPFLKRHLELLTANFQIDPWQYWLHSPISITN